VRVLLAGALGLATILAATGTSAASSTQQTMLQDDAQLVAGSQEQRDQRLDELKSLGVDIVKVRLSWRYITADGNSRTKPSGFDGADPGAYPAGAWAPYDAIVTGAQERGLGVMFQLGGSAPEWATPGKRNSAIRSPKASEFKAFVKAVGTRYSGSYGGPGSGPAPAPPAGPLPLPGIATAADGELGAPQTAGALPRVTLYSVWNEPNLKSWLTPQYRKGVPYSPAIYRRLLNAANDGLAESGHADDQLLLGELQPYAGTSTGKKKVRPLHFLRELACVNRRFRPYRGKAAKKRGCAKFRALPGSGLAYHPYTLAGGPNVRIRHRDDASINTLSRVTRTLDRLSSKRRLANRRLPLYISEFGFQSAPPDRYATPLRKIPGFLAQSERIAFKNSRVATFAQYPLVDDTARGGFQSGLRFKNGKPKPRVYNAFRHTIYVRRLSGSRVEVFGAERAAGSGSVTIESKRGKGKWKAVGTAPVNSSGYFNRRVRQAGASGAKFRYRYDTSKSRAARASRR
jgi:hypothetical protein